MRILIHGLGVPTKSMKIEPPHFINDSKKITICDKREIRFSN